MNPLDMLLVAVAAYCIIRGIFRGLVREISAIVGVCGGAYAGYTYYAQLAVVLSRVKIEGAYLHIFSFLILFAAVFACVSILGHIIKKILNVADLGWVDRTFGAVIGMLKALLVAVIMTFALTALLPKDSTLVIESRLAPHITIAAEQLARLVSPEVKQRYLSKLQELKSAWQVN